jgi:sugar phosphate isomerase/epimerase
MTQQKLNGQGPNLDRLSMNQITMENCSLETVIQTCVQHNIRWIAPWRHKVAEAGLQNATRMIRDSDLSVSSLCRGGMFAADTNRKAQESLDDNRRAVEEAAELGAKTLVLVCGPAADRDLDCARRIVADRIGELSEYARSRGVALGIEPLHPMYAGDRSVIVTLAQALEIASTFRPEEVGVIVDVFHVWWDPSVYENIHRSAGRILGFHVCDWLVPVPDMLFGRGMMGDGIIDIRRLREAVEAAGYAGPIEVEILNKSIWEQQPDEVIGTIKVRYSERV